MADVSWQTECSNCHHALLNHGAADHKIHGGSCDVQGCFCLGFGFPARKKTEMPMPVTIPTPEPPVITATMSNSQAALIAAAAARPGGFTHEIHLLAKEFQDFLDRTDKEREGR